MEQHFRLYTWQGLDFDITKEKRDPSKVAKSWGVEWDELQQLYPELDKRVGTSSFIWCYPDYVYWNRLEIRRLWSLCVPSSKILYFSDSGVWAKLMRNAESTEQPKDKEQSNEALWDKLLVKGSEGIEKIFAENNNAWNNNIALLIRIPLCNSIHVINKNKFSKADMIGCAKTPYDDLPISVCEAKKCQDRGTKRGNWKRQIKE